MINRRENLDIDRLFDNLKIDCKNCFGFCCVALYFSKSDGFPNDKEAGVPCKNLNKDFTCSLHSSLRDKGLKGCTIYDCFGAGQKVAQVTFKGKDWIELKKLSKDMFEAFLVVRSLHEMMWYLIGALANKSTNSIHDEVKSMIEETSSLANLSYEKLMELNIDNHRNKVNELLKKSSDLIHEDALKIKSKYKSKKINRGFDFIGKDLSKYNLIGADFKGSLLIAANLRDSDLSYANFIGADLRDADISGADLTNSVFVTQIQINSAKGNSKTKLPKNLTRPSYWEK